MCSAVAERACMLAFGGFRDKRGMLFWRIVEVLRAKLPWAFLLENVVGASTFVFGIGLFGLGVFCVSRV